MTESYDMGKKENEKMKIIQNFAFPPTRYECEEKVCSGDDRKLNVQRCEEGVAVEDPGGGVEEGEGEDDVLHAVDDGETAVLSPDSPPL